MNNTQNNKKLPCIMHVDMDAFFASVETTHNPTLKGKPVIVGGKPTDRGVVSSASYEARVFHIHSSMPLRKAYQLCPQGIFIRPNFHRYHIVSNTIADIFLSYTPDIQKVSLDEAYLDFSGFSLLYASIITIGKEIQQKVFDQTGATCSIGIASNKTVAKIASDFHKPHGFVFVNIGEEKNFLHDLNVRDMPGIGKKMELYLHNMNIFTLGDLAHTKLEVLIQRFGIYGKMLWRKANGFGSITIHSTHARKSIGRNQTFSQNTRNQTKLKQTMTYLLDKVASSLRKHKKIAKTIAIRLRYEDFTTITRHKTLSTPTGNTQILYDAMMGLFTTHLEHTRMVRLVGVRVSQLQSIHTPRVFQQNLFQNKTQDPEQLFSKLNKSVDTIRTRFGFDAIETAQEMGMLSHKK